VDLDIENPFNHSIDAIAGAGDVNGDGFADAVLGLPRTESSSTDPTYPGLVRAYFGGPSLDGAPDITLTGDLVGDGFGYSLSTTGDFDGDGLADLVIGAPFVDRASSGFGAGRASVYRGRPGPPWPPDAVLDGSEEEALGTALAGGGDVNGDGYSDWIVGAPQATYTACGDRPPGRAYVILGGPAPATFLLSGDHRGDLFGFSVALGRQPP
jgi:hypothetical protein